jgi:hypothetical protein
LPYVAADTGAAREHAIAQSERRIQHLIELRVAVTLIRQIVAKY